MSIPTSPPGGGIDWGQILEDQDDDTRFAALPVGQYPVQVTEAEVTQASAGASMIKVTAKVTEGPYEDRVLWSNLVFAKDNPMAMRMLLLKLAGLG